MRLTPGLGPFLAAIALGAALAIWHAAASPPRHLLSLGLLALIALLAVAEHRRRC